MPSTISALLHRTFSRISRLRARPSRNHNTSSPPPTSAVTDLPATRQLQAQDDSSEPKPAPLTGISAIGRYTNDHNKEVGKKEESGEEAKRKSGAWSWTESDEKDFSVLEGPSDTDLSTSNDEHGNAREEQRRRRQGEGQKEEEESKEENEPWEEEWEEIRMRLGWVAKQREVVIVAVAPDKEAEEGEEREEGKKGNKVGEYPIRHTTPGGSRAVFTNRVRKQLRQIALGDSDDEEEEVREEDEEEKEHGEVGVVCSRDTGSIAMRQRRRVTHRDVWWKDL